MLGVKDLDKYLLEKLDDRSLINLCRTNVKFYKLCGEEDFWRNRCGQKFFPNYIKYKPKDMKWKDFYLRSIYVSWKKLIYFTFKASSRPGYHISVKAIEYLQKLMEPLYEKLNHINIENIQKSLFSIFGEKNFEGINISLVYLTLEAVSSSDKSFYYKQYDKRRIIEYILNEIIELSIDYTVERLAPKQIMRFLSEDNEFYFLKISE
jgi:hypothetical protein